MTKVTYASLKLKTNTDVEIFDFNGNKIEVLKYLPVEDKYSLVNITLQNAKEGNIYNAVKLDMYFHLNLIYMYTNLSFTEKQREDGAKLYDTLISNGIVDKVIELIPDEEYSNLLEYINTTMNDILVYDNSLSGTIKNFIETLPTQAEEMQKIVDNFDQDKFQEVLNFAKAANGGRNI